jgi:serine/threonine-protein kinase
MLAHYRILERLGAGGMGEVYKALDTRLNRTVAIKILPRDAVADPARRQRFIQEAQAASALDHPNIITVYDIPEIDGELVLVMQYIEGKTLREILARGPLPLAETLRAAVQMADALALAHSRGILHRDLKPENVMLAGPATAQPGQVKILDFGLAKLVEPEESDTAATKSLGRALTQEGHVVGTSAYMSPEQAQGRKVDARTDI